jgi:hypothetical protein
MSRRIQLKPRKQWAIVILVFITLRLPLPLVLAQAKKSSGEELALRLVLSLDRHVIYAGESLTATVVVENRGAAGVFFLRSDIYNGSDTFNLYLRHDRHVDGPVSHLAGDSFHTARPSLADLLSRKWLALGSGKFYGTKMVLDPKDYPQLLIPGRYLIYGQYSSQGFTEEFRTYKDEVAELPFKPWEGRLESNSISIEVKPAPSSGRAGGPL